MASYIIYLFITLEIIASIAATNLISCQQTSKQNHINSVRKKQMESNFRLCFSCSSVISETHFFV